MRQNDHSVTVGLRNGRLSHMIKDMSVRKAGSAAAMHPIRNRWLQNEKRSVTGKLVKSLFPDWSRGATSSSLETVSRTLELMREP